MQKRKLTAVQIVGMLRKADRIAAFSNMPVAAQASSAWSAHVAPRTVEMTSRAGGKRFLIVDDRATGSVSDIYLGSILNH